MDDAHFRQYLGECRALVKTEIQRWIPARTRHRAELYDLLLDYPMREAKGLRPALCIALARGLGATLEAALPSAAVLELYHNAFLVHDDVEDGSEQRRGQPTLHGEHGVPIAVNVGDAMLALALRPLLDNTALIGLGRALRVLHAVSEMATTSAEGQALELHWIRRGLPGLDDALYLQMVEKKTALYSFVTPMQVGAVIAGAKDADLEGLRSFGLALGIAFQIQDDVLNLRLEASAYGKEASGDLWEGKYTLILLHALRSASPEERARALDILSKARPRIQPASHTAEEEPVGREALLSRLVPLLERSAKELALSAEERTLLTEALASPLRGGGMLAQPSQQNLPRLKQAEDVAWLRALIERHGSVAYAAGIAADYAARARAQFDQTASWLPASVHREFLACLVGYVTAREL